MFIMTMIFNPFASSPLSHVLRTFGIGGFVYGSGEAFKASRSSRGLNPLL